MAEIASGTLRDNERVKELLEIFSQSDEQGKVKDFSALILYVDSMEMQFDSVMKELQNVKLQLAKVQKIPVKDSLLGMVNTIENKIQEALSKLDHIKSNIIESSTQTLETVKQKGIAGLNKMAAFLGVRQALETIEDNLKHSGEMMENAIKKTQDAAQELRSVGSHIKNAGRILAGKERQEVTNGKDGNLAAAILAPMRGTRNILSGMEKAVASAIGNIEHLEQTVERQQPVSQEIKNENGVQPNREQYRSEYLANIERDYAECKEYLKYYDEIHGKPNAYFEAAMTAVHNRMLDFDGLTNIQLQEISKMDIPLMAVCCYFDGNVQKLPLSNEEIDIAIIDQANMLVAQSEYGEQTPQEQSNDMEH